MGIKYVIGFFLSLHVGASFAQFGSAPEKTALRHIEKHRWLKAERTLRKALQKDTLNPAVRYALSVFFFHRDNPAVNLDSAYRYAVTALDDYTVAPVKTRDRLYRVDTDSAGLVALRTRIDSTAFMVARQANTEAAYLEFLSHFPLAVQRALAEQLRDEVAFQSALDDNTHDAFLSYLQRYPASARAPEAKARYDRLLYQDRTRDRRLSSYEKFLADYPETPYRREVYRQIFEISTADGSVESFLSFASRYPMSDLGRRARQMVFYILSEQDAPQWPRHFLNDSLQNLLTLKNRYLVPVLQNDLYGFIDESGTEVISPRFQTIGADYLCGAVADEILAVNDQLVTRTGSLVYDGRVDEIADLGIGFLKVKTEEGLKVIHKAGFTLLENLQDAFLPGKQYLAAKRNGKWNLFTLTGRLLDSAAWDTIAAVGDLIVFSRDDRHFIALSGQISDCAEGLPLRLSEPFDEVRAWKHNLVWGRSGQYQGVLTQALQGFIGFDRHTLTQTSFGVTAAIHNGFVLYNLQGRKSSTFERVKRLGDQVAVSRNGAWFLYDPVRQEMTSRAYDSLRAEGPFVVGLRADTVNVHFVDGRMRSFIRPPAVAFIPGMDSSSFLCVQDRDRDKTVFDLEGNALFTALFDAVEYGGAGVFVITKNGKKGLVNSAGKRLVPADYDAVGSAKDHMFSLLKDKRFGAYSITHNRLIKPQYDRNLLAYNGTAIVTYKDGYYGFLGWDNKPLSAFEFDEIRYWDDSVALVRKGAYWGLYEIQNRRILEGNIRKINMVKDTDAEKVAIIQRNSNYGVIGSRRGTIIPVTFSDIINVGTPDEPLYFTEKHIKEASLFIVIYYDRDGHLLRREIYDDAADYDKIYCSDN